MSHSKLYHEAAQMYAATFGTKKLAVETEEKQYDLAVVLGRFEPLHAGHQLLINRALMVAERVLVLIGSSHSPRTIKNPFTYAERAQMVTESAGTYCVMTAPLVDNLYSDDEWVKSVQDHVTNNLMVGSTWENVPTKKRVAIVGNKKDESSYYLDLFPQYEYIAVDEVKLDFDATTIREVLFEKPGFIELLKSLVPEYTFSFIKEFIKTEDYRRLQREYMMVQKYKDSWKAAPYAPTFVTVDAVVKKLGHVLMVKRKASPGEGLWAIPGGFLEQKERLTDGAIRELKEETSIDLATGLLSGSMSAGVVFDHPGRSLRGRTITHAFLFDLDKQDKKPGLPKVKGADDALEAKWIPIAELLKMSDQIFEDHLSIIRTVLGV